MVSGSDAALNSLFVSTAVTASTFSGSFRGNLTGTASYVSGNIYTSTNPALSASYALSSSYAGNSLSASYLNPLNQPYIIATGSIILTGSVIVSGSNTSLLIGGNVTASTEASLIIGVPPSGVVNGEGGQIILQAPMSGGFTSASHLDNYQDQFRILRGNNTSSLAVVAQFNLHTKQMQLPAYNGSSAFVGTAAANLAVDSSGNVITVSTSGGSVFPYTGTAVITGSLVVSNEAGYTGAITASGPIRSLANNAMYFRGGDDAEFWDINVPNTVGIYGIQDRGIGSIKLGSGGGTLYGISSSIGIGTTTPSNATNLDVSGISNVSGSFLVTGSVRVTGSVSATQGGFTGSLFGTASWASNVVTAQTASYLNNLNQNLSITGSVTLSGSTAIELIVLGEQQITGSLNVNNGIWAGSVTSSFTGSLTGNLIGTASVTTNAATASTISNITGFTGATPYYIPLIQNLSTPGQPLYYPAGGWFFLNETSRTLSVTSSFATTASYVTGSVHTSTNPALSASYAITASYALNGGGGSTFPYTGTAQINGGLVVTGSTILSGSAGVELTVLGDQQVTGSVNITGSLFASNIKAGTIAATSFTSSPAGSPSSSAVTFNPAFASNNYAVTVTGDDARIWDIESKTAAGFTVSSNSIQALTGNTYWIAIGY